MDRGPTREIPLPRPSKEKVINKMAVTGVTVARILPIN